MSEAKKQVTIAVSAALFDAGEVTRSLEIVKGVRDGTPEGYSVRIIFLSNGGKFEQRILDNGFEVYHTAPQLEGVGFYNDLKPDGQNFIGSEKLCKELLEGEISALQDCRPDLVLYGFWPFASLARRMVRPQIPGVCFLPLPLERNLYGSSLMKDVPDQIKPLTYLPEGLRCAIMRALPAELKLKAPILQQKKILNAAQQCGWNGSNLNNLFDLLKSDLTLVNDLEDYYKGMRIPPDYVITGPLYSQPAEGEQPDAGIREVFKRQDGKCNLFCTMGSSGRKELLAEAVSAVASLPEERFHAVILAPDSVCPMEELAPIVAGKSNIYMTNRFVPAKLVNRMADIVLCHGGQGTVQTAMASSTPLVGVAMQPEQQINLDNVVGQGAGIRIPQTRWNRNNIISAINKVTANPGFRRNAERLAQSMASVDGKRKSAEIIWKFIH
ncbi:MAG TPA: nucleotide disphospho-sugar-binding domain-containing protein [Caproicibacter sp.]|nr:nucleotide disphospho-sugar-binding domain-containing protein [Caproicibacter sp.]